MNKELSDFAARLRRSISSDFQGRDFGALALDLFALQFENNPAYQKICRARGVTPQAVEHWTQIPAVPTSAFKELELSSIPATERTAVFHSSGTTEQKPSRHYHNAESLALYETSLWSWFEKECGMRNAECGMVVLTPPPSQAPHSSLVHMFETIRQKLGDPKNVFVGNISADGAWALDNKAVLAILKSSIINRQSQILLGTAFSFVHLLDFLAEQDLKINLPAGSRVMETGGYKNRSRTMPKSELHSLITDRLGVPPENIICEYGMSELSSQAYAVTSDTCQVARQDGASCHLSPVTCHFRFPPWSRAQIVSPETGREVADSGTGLIRIFDLANVFSVAAIQTEDLGIRRGDGFELIGRAELAEPRGCSLMSHSAFRTPHSALK